MAHSSRSRSAVSMQTTGALWIRDVSPGASDGILHGPFLGLKGAAGRGVVVRESHPAGVMAPPVSRSGAETESRGGGPRAKVTRFLWVDHDDDGYPGSMFKSPAGVPRDYINNGNMNFSPINRSLFREIFGCNSGDKPTKKLK